MKLRPIHENLDTSFVNLPALLRYLRRREFNGRVRIELSGYEADIYLSEKNDLAAREHDRTAGRVAEGKDALQRILIRSREAGGIISVYQTIEEGEINEKGAADEKETISSAAQNFVGAAGAPTTIPEKPAQTKPIQDIKPAKIQFSASEREKQNLPSEKSLNEKQASKPKINAPVFPFEFSNKVENKAARADLSPEDWQTLLSLINELLATVDEALAGANLDFAAAFQKARSEIAPDYPFLSPSSDGFFEYRNGKISMREQVSARLFIAGIVESLRRILEKLSANPKFSQLYQQTKQKLLALFRSRKPLYDKFSITRPLEKILGV